MRLNRDAALTLQIHRVQRLLLQFTRRDRMRQFKNTIRKRRLTMVDVRNDTEITNVLKTHGAALSFEFRGTSHPSQL